MEEIAYAGIGLLAQERADAQVLLDGEAGEDAAPLWHDPHPAEETRCAVIPVTSAPSMWT